MIFQSRFFPSAPFVGPSIWFASFFEPATVVVVAVNGVNAAGITIAWCGVVTLLEPADFDETAARR